MVKAICAVAAEAQTVVARHEPVLSAARTEYSPSSVFRCGPGHQRLHWGRSGGGGHSGGGGGGYSGDGGGGDGGGSAALHACPVQSIAGAPAAD